MKTPPYKLLDYYEPADETIFFGREQESLLVSELIMAHHLVLLYGASGNGKTSLLLAGVTPRLQQPRGLYEVVYVRLFEQPEQAIRQTVQRRLGMPLAPIPDAAMASNMPPIDKMYLFSRMAGRFNDTELNGLIFNLRVEEGVITGANLPDRLIELVGYFERRGQIQDLYQALARERPDIFQEITHRGATPTRLNNTPADGLVAFLEQAAQHSDRPMILILDQFEELFYRVDPQSRRRFIAELGSIVRAPDIPVRFVISIREEMLAALSELEEYIPTIFYNKRRLLPLSRQQALAAVTQPLEDSMVYEETAVTRLLDDLAISSTEALYPSDQIMPTHLQLVCSALYERARVNNQTRITLANYEQAGGVQGILGHYLEEAFRQFPAQERPVARLILEELVSSTGSRQVVALSEMANRAGSPVDEITRVLQRLILAHLVRRIDDGLTMGYELVHDFLAQKINMTPEVQARKAVEEMVMQDLQNWRNFGAVISPDRLQIIASFQEQLRLSQEAKELIQKSRQKQAEDEEIQLQLIQADKLNFLSQLAAGIDKEISSPITTIVSNSHYLRQGVVGMQFALPGEQVGAEWQEWWEDIAVISHELEEAAAKMTGLIHALSNFAQSDQAASKPVDLQATLDAALLLLGYYTLRQHVRVQAQYTSQPLQVMGSPGQLVHLLMNVWMNCLEMLESDRETGLDKIIKVVTRRDTAVALIEFHVFSQTAAKPGLSPHRFDVQIARQIAHNHGGFIELKEDSDQEIVFVLQLPLIVPDGVEVGE